MSDVLNDAVPPHQRLEAWFKPCETDPDVIRRRKAMILEPLNGPWSADYRDERMYMDGHIDMSNANVPDWVRHARGVLTSPALDHARMLGTTPESRELFYLLSPMTGYGLQILLASLPKGPVAIHDDAIRGMLEGLGKRIMHACIGVANVEVMSHLEAAKFTGTQDSFTMMVDGTTYEDLYRRYPGLPFVIGTTITQWHSCVVELLARLQHDHDRIIREMPEVGCIDALRYVSMDAGDLHDGGRSVAILGFDNDVRLVYKPKDLRIVQHVQTLFADINLALGEPLLHVRTMVLGQAYAWEEYVSNQPCLSIDDVALYYRRYGAMIRMYEQLEARDLWLDNVVAHGAWPVVIDLEMVLQPWLAPLIITRPSEFLAQQRIADTCHPIGLVSMMFPIAPGQEPEDMGGLTPHRAFRTPFLKPEAIQTAASTTNQVMLTNDIYTPTFNGKHVDVRQWHVAVYEGYQRMSVAILHEVQSLLLDWVTHLPATLPVRAIFRDTWTYQQAINASCSASNLRSVYHRESFLLRFPLSYQHKYPYDSVQCRTAFSELAQLRSLDIPYFATYINDGELRESSGRSLGTLYHGSAHARYVERCTHPGDVAFRSDVLAAALASGYGGDAATTTISIAEGVETVDAIGSIVDDLCSWAIREGDDHTWVSFLYHAAFQGVVFESLRPTMHGSLHLALSLRKAQIVIDRPDVTPIIAAIVDHARQVERMMVEEMRRGVAQPWYSDPAIGLPALQSGLAAILECDSICVKHHAVPKPLPISPLRSSTNVPPRLWLVGPHGVCRLLETLVESLIAS